MENNCCILNIHVIPGSKLNQISGFMENGLLKIKIKAKPIEGKANKELIKTLARILAIKESEIEISSGQNSRNKKVIVRGINERNLQKKISDSISQDPKSILPQLGQ
jgi:uncharacterized protein (TIGR00251 family)